MKKSQSQIMDYAIENDLAFRNVFAKVKIPAAPETERKPLTDEQIRLVTEHWQGHRAGVGALIMLYCGLRRGELIPLTWADVDLEEKAITINKSVDTVSNTYTVKQGAKTEAGSRVVDIPDCIIPALRQAKASADGLLVLPGADGGLLTNQGYKRLWESYMHYLNICAGGRDKKRTKNEDGKPAFTPALQVIEPFTAHQLRHTYATGADSFEILPQEDYYPYTYDELTDVAKKEQNENARPAYAGEVPDLSQYDTVFIGAPVWWGDWPMICYTFFENNANALSGKTLIPFSTHEGSGLSGFDRKLASTLPDSTVGEGLAIQGNDAQNNQDSVKDKVNDWLSGLGF